MSSEYWDPPILGVLAAFAVMWCIDAGEYVAAAFWAAFLTVHVLYEWLRYNAHLNRIRRRQL